MKKLMIFAAALSATVIAGPAAALSNVTFVSGKGANVGSCTTAATACRSFAYAIGQTNPGGEIKTLDPANYGPFVIDRSLKVTGIEGASIVQTEPAGSAI